MGDLSKNTIGEQNKVNYSAVNEINQLQKEIFKRTNKSERKIGIWNS